MFQNNGHSNFSVTFRNGMLWDKTKMHLRSGTQGKRGYNGGQTSLTITVELNEHVFVAVSRFPPIRHTEDVLL